MRTSEATNEIATALAAAQGEFKVIEKRKRATIKTNSGRDFGYAYADISDILAGVLPHLSKHGLSVIQPTSVIDGNLYVTTRLMHSSGQWFESDYPVCSLHGDHQKMGGAMTYSRRQALTSMVGAAADEDVDGQGAADPPVEVMSTRATLANAKPPPRPALASVRADPAAALAAFHDKARGMAREGVDALGAWWGKLSDEDALKLNDIYTELADIAKAADAAEVMRAG